MPLVGEPAGYPRMPEQQSDVMPGSPLAVVALFTEVVRQRFLAGNQLAWVWTDDPTPELTETNDVDAPRKLLIEPAFNVNTEARNFRPAIYVDKDRTTADKVAVGNLAGQELKSGMRGFYALANVPMEVEVVSDKKGESATLADITWFYLLSGRDLIRATFGFQDMTNPELGRTVPFEADKEQWSTKVTFSVTLGLRWTTKPISPLLREIVIGFRRSGETNPDAFLLRQYIR